MFFNMTTWGIIHLVLGVGLVVVGYALLKGSEWANVAAAIILGLNIISTFLFASAYPAWAFILIAINGFTLWAVLVHGRRGDRPGLSAQTSRETQRTSTTSSPSPSIWRSRPYSAV